MDTDKLELIVDQELLDINSQFSESASQDKESNFNPTEYHYRILDDLLPDNLGKKEFEKLRNQLGLWNNEKLPDYLTMVNELLVHMGENTRFKKDNIDLKKEIKNLQKFKSRFEILEKQKDAFVKQYDWEHRIPPQDLESEMTVLGLYLKNPKLCDEFNQKYLNLMFYREVHKTIHASMLDLGDKLNQSNILHHLKDKSALEFIGGNSYLSTLNDYTKDMDEKNLTSCLERIEHQYLKRKLIIGCTQIIDGTYHGEFEEGITNFIRKSSIDILDIMPFRYRMRNDIKSDTQEVQDNFSKLIKRNGKPLVSSGYDKVDRFMRILPGKFHVVGADTKMGKTTFISNLAYNLGIENNSTLIFTFESSREEIIHKLIAKHANIDSEIFEYYDNLDESIIKRVEEASEYVKNLPIIIDDVRPPNIDYIIARSKQIKMQHPELSLVVVDGMQSFDGYVPYQGNKSAIYAEVLKQLKNNVSAEAQVSTLLTAQIKTTQVLKRKTNRPNQVDDFADCNDISKVADSAFFLYRPEEYWPDDNKYQGWVEIIPCAMRVGSKKDKSAKLGIDIVTSNIYEI